MQLILLLVLILGSALSQADPLSIFRPHHEVTKGAVLSHDGVIVKKMDKFALSVDEGKEISLALKASGTPFGISAEGVSYTTMATTDVAINASNGAKTLSIYKSEKYIFVAICETASFSTCSKILPNPFFKDLATQKYLLKGAVSNHAGEIISKTKDNAIRASETKAFAKELASSTSLVGKRMSHEGLQFDIMEAQKTYIVGIRRTARTLAVQKTGVFIFYTLCGPKPAYDVCVAKSAEFANYVKELGY